MWCWKELRKPYKLVWNGHPKPNGITVMLFLFTIPCTTAHLMKCALTNMRLIRSKPSTQICATTWNDWRVNPDVSQEEYNRWLRTCNSLSIVITTDNWPSAASQNMLRTWSTSFVLYLRHSQKSYWKAGKLRRLAVACSYVLWMSINAIVIAINTQLLRRTSL